MKIGKKFNQLSISEYKHYIDNHKKYTDFNTLGLYRSIGENEKLTIDDRIEIRDYANETFEKTFNFYQLKDPKTYFELITLGQELTKGDESRIWDEIKHNQQEILKKKRIKHRNFGDYSKHNCVYENCPMNGLMIKQGSWFAEKHMFFESDRIKHLRKEKSEKIKKERKTEKRIIRNELESKSNDAEPLTMHKMFISSKSSQRHLCGNVVLHAEKMKNPYFDIEWIIDLIKEQEPDRTYLVEQLKKSDRKKWIRQPYIHFVSGARPNQPGSEWQFEENIVLEHESEGTIVLDILKDGRIGGIEFVNQIPHS